MGRAKTGRSADRGSVCDLLSVDRRLAKLAKLGIDEPAELSLRQVQQICWALSITYAQMGIG